MEKNEGTEFIVKLINSYIEKYSYQFINLSEIEK
jgi:hypothetical protein